MSQDRGTAQSAAENEWVLHDRLLLDGPSFGERES
jgi:hypothetical protein